MAEKSPAGARRTIRRACVAVAVVFGTSVAALENENLLAPLPAGYKIDFQDRKGNMLLSEMVPANENVNNWTEMVTVQIFFGMKSVTPNQFKARIDRLMTDACPSGQSKALGQSAANGYPAAMWVMRCPRNPKDGKPENTWFKAIAGNDSFYVVQKAFRFAPSKEQEARWLQYLQSVSVCDTRVPDRDCPKASQ